jgi:hypothetical protein
MIVSTVDTIENIGVNWWCKALHTSPTELTLSVQTGTSVVVQFRDVTWQGIIYTEQTNIK